MNNRIRQLLKSVPGYPWLRSVYWSLKNIGTTDEQWGRVVMNRETREIINSLKPAESKALEISGTTWGEWTTFKEYKSAYYPEFDICETSVRELPSRFPRGGKPEAQYEELVAKEPDETASRNGWRVSATFLVESAQDSQRIVGWELGSERFKAVKGDL